MVQQLPHLTIMKHNLAVEPHRLYSLLQEFRAELEHESLVVDSTDGLKITLPSGWVHVRASNTESLIRISVEAKQKKEASHILSCARDRLIRGVEHKSNAGDTYT